MPCYCSPECHCHCHYQDGHLTIGRQLKYLLVMASKMAERENLACLCQINIELVVDVFWEIVTHYIPANQLVIRISKFLPTKLKKTFHFRLDNLCQLGRDPEKSDCDFLVLYAIIRYLCPLSPLSAGWGQPRTPNDTSIWEDVECIYESRKSLICYVHYLPVLTDDEFQGYIKKYETIIGRLGIKLGTNFNQRLHTIVNESIQSDNLVINSWPIHWLKTQNLNEEATAKLVKFKNVRFDDLEIVLNDLQMRVESDVQTHCVNQVKRELHDCTLHLLSLDVPMVEIEFNGGFVLPHRRSYFDIRTELIKYRTERFLPLDVNLQIINTLRTVLTQTIQQTKSRQTIAKQVLEQISRLQHTLNEVLKMSTSRQTIKTKYLQETTQEQTTKDLDEQEKTGLVASIWQATRERMYRYTQPLLQMLNPFKRFQPVINKEEHRFVDMLDIPSIQRRNRQRPITEYLPDKDRAATGIVEKRSLYLRQIHPIMEDIMKVKNILERSIGNVANVLVELERCLRETTSRHTTLEQHMQRRASADEHALQTPRPDLEMDPVLNIPENAASRESNQAVVEKTSGADEHALQTPRPDLEMDPVLNIPENAASRESNQAVVEKTSESLLLLYSELKDKLRRDQCRALVKDIAAESPLPAEEKASFQGMTKRRDLVDWVLKYVLNQKEEMVFKIFCKSLCKHSPSLGQTLQETSVEKHGEKTDRQPMAVQLDVLHFLQRSFISKLVVDIIIDKLLSRFLITVEEHSFIRSSIDESEMTKRLTTLLQYDKEIMQPFELIIHSFRNASGSHTADWLVPLHAQSKETLNYGKGIAIATDLFQQIPGIISPSDLDEIYKLKDSSRDVIDRLLKHIYRQPGPEVFDVICYSLEDHDEELYEHFLRMFFFKGADKEKTKPVVNRENALPIGSGTDYLYHILQNRQTIDVVIDHLLSSFCITVDQHSDIRNVDSINGSINKLVELLEQSPHTIMAVNAILKHLDKIADTKFTGDKEITISVDFGDPAVNSQAKNYMDSFYGQPLPLAGIGKFNLNDVNDGSVVIKISPLDRESLRRFRDMEKDGTILRYLREHVKEFLPDDVEVNVSELSIGVIERTTSVPIQSASIINATIELPSGKVYRMENEPFVPMSILPQDHSKCIGSIWMYFHEPLSEDTKCNSLEHGLVFAGRLGSTGVQLAIKRIDLQTFPEILETYETVKERLQKHPNIVEILCIEKDRRYGYVAMERMDENLVKYVARSGQHGNTDMNTEQESYYMKHIVTGLAFMHKQGFLHNMFSPRAILLKKKNPDTHPKQVSIACFSDAALYEHVPVSCKKGTTDVLELLKVLLFVLNKEEAVVNGVIQLENSILHLGHSDNYVLLQDILDSRKSDELKLQYFELHPALYNPSDRLRFLKDSDRLRQGLRVDFNGTNRTLVNINNLWLDEPPLTRIVHQYLINGRTPCKYEPQCLNSLVRCIRNCHEHLPEIIPQVQEEFDPKERYINYWLVKFPGLVSSVYDAMRPHKDHPDMIRYFPNES